MKKMMFCHILWVDDKTDHEVRQATAIVVSSQWAGEGTVWDRGPTFILYPQQA